MLKVSKKLYINYRNIKVNLMKTILFNVREATIDDIPIIAEMNIKIANETEDKHLNENIIFEGVKLAITNPSLAKYFIAEDTGVITGQTMLTYEWSDWRAGLIWWLQSVYVLPKYRGQGCFRSIYQFIKLLAKKDSLVKAIRLYVKDDNEIGKSVYSKLGMNSSGYIVYEEVWDK